MKILIKHFDTPEQKEEAEKVLRGQGLKRFDSLRFQFARIPAGEYEIDEAFIFSNQYNTKDIGEKRGYRIFEYCEALSVPGARPLGYGYYIAEGIQQIRALQAQISVCGYCGAQYRNTKKAFCSACWGSEYLTEKDFKLLKLVKVLDRDHFKYDTVKVPAAVKAKIEQAQEVARLRRLAKAKRDKIASLREERFKLNRETLGFKWLIRHGLDFDNVIYYNHADIFAFGWRTPLNDSQKAELTKKLKDFPYVWEFAKKT